MSPILRRTRTRAPLHQGRTRSRGCMRVVVATLVISWAAQARAQGTYSEQADYERTAASGAIIIGIGAAGVATGNIYAISTGHRQIGWVIPGLIGAGTCGIVGLLSFMYGKVGATYGAGYLAAGVTLATLSTINLRLPRRPEPPRELAEPEAMLVPTVLPGASAMVPGLALTATW